MTIRKAIGAAAIGALLLTADAAVSKSSPPAQDFNNGNFQINRDRVTFGTIKSCAKGTAYLIPTTYLYVTVRTKLSAGGGLGNAKSKARVFIDGLTKSELQELAGDIQNEIVGQLRASGYKVLTWDDVKGDVADKERWENNPRYGVPTHDARAFPGTDFAVATPSDEQTLSYGLMGPAANFGKAAARTDATLLLPEIYLTLPQLGASANVTQTETWKSSSSNISFDPAMHLAGATIYGSTAKGGWCSIVVPEHGGRLPAADAGEFKELGISEDKYGDWAVKSGDFTFEVNDAAFRTGVLATGRSLAHLVADTMNGVK